MCNCGTLMCRLAPYHWSCQQGHFMAVSSSACGGRAPQQLSADLGTGLRLCCSTRAPKHRPVSQTVQQQRACRLSGLQLCGHTCTAVAAAHLCSGACGVSLAVNKYGMDASNDCIVRKGTSNTDFGDQWCMVRDQRAEAVTLYLLLLHAACLVHCLMSMSAKSTC